MEELLLNIVRLLSWATVYVIAGTTGTVLLALALYFLNYSWTSGGLEARLHFYQHHAKNFKKKEPEQDVQSP